MQSEIAKEKDRLPDAKAGRVIVRNLGFDLREKHLKTLFSKFGEIINVNVPLNSTDNRSRGFGFVEFSNKDQALQAIKSLNGEKFKGRKITIELSMPKLKYEKKI